MLQKSARLCVSSLADMGVVIVVCFAFGICIQYRYRGEPIKWREISVRLGGSKVVPRGLEPRTLRLLAIRSNQLCYETCGFGTEASLPMPCAPERLSHGISLCFVFNLPYISITEGTASLVSIHGPLGHEPNALTAAPLRWY